MAQTITQPQGGLTREKLLIVLALMALAFFGAYNYAVARNTSGSAAGLGQPAFFGTGGGLAAGGGCCGGGGAPVEGTATIEGDVQKITVDTSAGSFNPNVLKVKAGIPVEISFSQAPGGCLSGVLFPDFDVNEDLTQGPKAVKLPALQKGSYQFFCQMQMISAQIIAE